MREIEIKARVRDPKAVLGKLKDMGVVLGKPVTQRDIVFGQPGMKGGEQQAIWLRIRIENDKKFLLTLKKPIVGHLDSIEHELEVSDPIEMEAIVTLLGFELYSDMTKLRSKGKLGDIEICIDEVIGLGKFIEAERLLYKDVDHEKTEQELWELLLRVGIRKSDEEHEGYDVIERRKRGLSVT